MYNDANESVDTNWPTKWILIDGHRGAVAVGFETLRTKMPKTDSA
jgi:hypothetical protein